MDKNQEAEGRVSHIELGPLTLNCLRRLAEAIERAVPSVNTPHPLPLSDTIPSPGKESPFFNAEEAAAYLGTTVSSLYGLVERRQIEPMRGPRRRYRLTKVMLDDYLKRGRRS